jgi:Helicase conserved C-terminal domain
VTTQEARDAIVQYVRSELVGPAPGFPAMQLNREEILRPQDPPRLRYSADILFPLRSSVPSQLDVREDVAEVSEAAPLEDPGGPETGPEELPVSRVDLRSEQQPETEMDLNLANQYLPSAMGVSALVEVPDHLAIRVTAAQYAKVDLPGLAKSGSRKSASHAWFRKPIVTDLTLPAADFLGVEVRTTEHPVLVDGAAIGLCVHVVSRPYSLSEASGRTRLVTFTLINRNVYRSSSNDEMCFFQCRLEVSDAAGAGCFLEYPDRRVAPDDEERSLQFLYRHRKVFSVGHGCAGEWSEQSRGRCARIWTESLPVHEVKPIEHVELPDISLSMEQLADERSPESLRLCEALADAYAGWIEQQQQRMEDPADVPPEFRNVASRNLSDCRLCLSRIRAGIELLKEDTDVRTAFALANNAMYLQQAHYELASKNVRDWVFKDGSLRLSERYQPPNYSLKKAQWRPFQLAFLLMNLQSLADPESPERSVVDLIWFPTGGGKTEAYLGLSAFTIMLRRLRNPDNAGTTVLMRYTLRLLTAQQFQRAASLICACEHLRRSRPKELGATPISIGLWVGQGVTPNRHADATRALNELHKGSRENPFILLACSWCGAAMGAVKAGTSWRVKGYLKKTNPSRVVFCCEDPDCPFGAPDGLPLQVVDEAIYAEPPSLVIGTVDKFAMLPWRPEARSLFGMEHGYDPPELIVQDELHLISGPLGSMVAHYETAIEALCRARVENRLPKILASTATIARAPDQIRALYNDRSSFLFPPQGLLAGESFFAWENPNAAGRCYLGVFASALPSHVTAQIRVVSALLQAVKLLSTSDPATLDPYWTLMAYFNSIRELGHAATLIRADIREYMNAMWDRRGLTGAIAGQEALKMRRFINRDLELTSRIQSNQIPEILQQLFTPVRAGDEQNAVDICLATNMIQVGLDVPRLSLMTVIGQPKTTAEYIQASSRVGRREPGLVVTIYNPGRPRDRSHYEHFRAYHQSIYRFVEPTSITPFAQPVIERALHAVAVALTRALGSDNLRTRPNSPPPDDELIERIRAIILDRVSNVDREQTGAALDRFDDVFDEWCRVPPSRYGDFSPPDEVEPLMYPSGTDRHPRWSVRPLATPSSMRNVDATCDANVISSYPQPD